MDVASADHDAEISADGKPFLPPKVSSAGGASILNADKASILSTTLYLIVPHLQVLNITVESHRSTAII